MRRVDLFDERFDYRGLKLMLGGIVLAGASVFFGWKLALAIAVPVGFLMAAVGLVMHTREYFASLRRWNERRRRWMSKDS